MTNDFPTEAVNEAVEYYMSAQSGRLIGGPTDYGLVADDGEIFSIHASMIGLVKVFTTDFGRTWSTLKAAVRFYVEAFGLYKSFMEQEEFAVPADECWQDTQC